MTAITVRHLKHLEEFSSAKRRFEMAYIVQNSVDGGETWERCSEVFRTDEEAVVKKREIENHVGEDSPTIELRVVERGFCVRQGEVP